LKGNQGQLHEDVVQFFEYAQAKGFKDIPHSFHEPLDADHGRIEIRRYWTVDHLDWLEDKAQWKGFNLIGMVESERHTGGKVRLERRYYLSSVDNQAMRFALDTQYRNFSISPGNFIETKPQRIEKQGITFLNSPTCPDLLRSYSIPY
jgi:hypothetical protein